MPCSRPDCSILDLLPLAASGSSEIRDRTSAAIVFVSIRPGMRFAVCCSRAPRRHLIAQPGAGLPILVNKKKAGFWPAGYFRYISIDFRPKVSVAEFHPKAPGEHVSPTYT
jgi:hypothetical protein